MPIIPINYEAQSLQHLSTIYVESEDLFESQSFARGLNVRVRVKVNQSLELTVDKSIDLYLYLHLSINL